MSPRTRTVAIALAAAAGSIWLGWRLLTMYSVPPAERRMVRVTHRFLEAALAQDSAALKSAAATSQPVRWALAAAARHPDAIREWSINGGWMDRRNDTTWVSLRRNRSTPHCPFMSSLTAAFVGANGKERMVHMSASCPSDSG